MSGNLETTLFAPVLQDRSPSGRIYSDRALFYTAIAGGATPAILLSLANTFLLGRWRADGLRLIFAVLAAALVLPVSIGLATTGQLPAWMDALPNGGGMVLVRFGGHFFGVLVALFLWAPIRRIYNHAYNTKNTRNPWMVSIGCILAGGSIEFAVTGHVGLMVFWRLQ